MKRIIASLALLGALTAPAIAGPYYDQSTSTATGRGRLRIAGTIEVSKSSGTIAPSSPTIVLDGMTGGVNASSATLTYSVKAATAVFSTNAIVGSAAPDASAVFEASSTSKGFLMPRMTTTQRDAISSPKKGLLIWNDTTATINAYDGSSWGAISGSGGAASTQTVTWVRDNFLGSVNGVTTAFTLSQTPSSAQSIFVFLDGSLQSGTSDYSYSAPTTITMATAPASNSTQFQAIYTVNTSTLPGAAFPTAAQSYSWNALQTLSSGAVIGNGVAPATFSATGQLITGSSITLTGSGGYISGASSITTTGTMFSGDHVIGNGTSKSTFTATQWSAPSGSSITANGMSLSTGSASNAPGLYLGTDNKVLLQLGTSISLQSPISIDSSLYLSSTSVSVTTKTGNANVETWFSTMTLNANVLAKLGDGFTVRCFGHTGANAAATKLFSTRVCGTVVSHTGTYTTGTAAWVVETKVRWKNANFQDYYGTTNISSQSPKVINSYQPTSNALNCSPTAAMTVACTGTSSTGGGDFSWDGMEIQFP